MFDQISFDLTFHVFDMFHAWSASMTLFDLLWVFRISGLFAMNLNKYSIQFKWWIINLLQGESYQS